MEVRIRAAKHSDIDMLVNLLRELFEIEEDFASTMKNNGPD